MNMKIIDMEKYKQNQLEMKYDFIREKMKYKLLSLVPTINMLEIYSIEIDKYGNVDVIFNEEIDDE